MNEHAMHGLRSPCAETARRFATVRPGWRARLRLLLSLYRSLRLLRCLAAASRSLPLVLLLALANTAVAGAVMAEAGASKEYQIKAAFLFNFAQFVEWPAAAFDDAGAPIRICVMGDDPFGGTLEQIVRGETIDQRALVVQHAHDVLQAGDCHLLFISHSEKGRMTEILNGLGPGAVLTVSEIEHFAEHGGTLNFFMESNRIRFEVNPASAKRQGLRLSAQLLKLGRIVDEQPGAGMH